MADTKIYRIKSGDTLSKISKEFNISVDKLASDNNIKNINLIKTGKELTIENVDLDIINDKQSIKEKNNKIIDNYDTSTNSIRDEKFKLMSDNTLNNNNDNNTSEIKNKAIEDSSNSIKNLKNEKFYYEHHKNDDNRTPEEIKEQYKELYQNNLPKSLTNYTHECAKLSRQQLYVNGFLKDEGHGVNGLNLAKYYADNKNLLLKGDAIGYPTNNSTQIATFENIIDDNGGNLKNLMISFSPNANGSFSSKYGHVVLISEIKDGNVYFVDDFSVPNWGTKVGECNSLSIEEFENSYLKASNNANYMTHFVDENESAYSKTEFV